MGRCHGVYGDGDELAGGDARGGIIRLVVAVLILLLVQEPDRQPSLVEGLQERGEEMLVRRNRELKSRDFLAVGKEFKAALNYVVHLRSFWLLVLSVAFRVKFTLRKRRVSRPTTNLPSCPWITLHHMLQLFVT